VGLTPAVEHEPVVVVPRVRFMVQMVHGEIIAARTPRLRAGAAERASALVRIMRLLSWLDARLKPWQFVSLIDRPGFLVMRRIVPGPYRASLSA
jgi:hypothetical protein